MRRQITSQEADRRELRLQEFWRQANATRNIEAARRRQSQIATHYRLMATRPLVLGQDLSLVQISTEAVAGLGWLAIFPNEVIMLILAHCTMRTLLNLTRVNRGAREFVHLLPDFHYVKSTLMLQLDRASPAYQKLLIGILKITTYSGLHFLTTTRQCEKCSGSLASFRVTRLKVLCNDCFVRRQSSAYTRGQAV
ncbi:hypothetical protein O1611_g6941 [Lasiodiplodia mahajangana]|uniref:Uncharacterized protein n=1 Tax=Lasiodiplodia mahajangana TaxID=1108764 RepID=A0ACC2JHK6_9PEZI|nr:hypothetical protein O1611_g6941 [Lasiodiplodia mahajangana]